MVAKFRSSAPFQDPSNATVVVRSQVESLRFLVLKVDENKRISDIVSCVLFVYFPAECFYVLCLVFSVYISSVLTTIVPYPPSPNSPILNIPTDE